MNSVLAAALRDFLGRGGHGRVERGGFPCRSPEQRRRAVALQNHGGAGAFLGRREELLQPSFAEGQGAQLDSSGSASVPPKQPKEQAKAQPRGRPRRILMQGTPKRQSKATQSRLPIKGGPLKGAKALDLEPGHDPRREPRHDQGA